MKLDERYEPPPVDPVRRMSRLAKFAAHGLFWAVLILSIQAVLGVIAALAYGWIQVASDKRSEMVYVIVVCLLFAVPIAGIVSTVLKMYSDMTRGQTEVDSSLYGLIPIIVGVVLWPIGGITTMAGFLERNRWYFVPLGLSWFVGGLLLSICGLLVLILRREYRRKR